MTDFIRFEDLTISSFKTLGSHDFSILDSDSTQFFAGILCCQQNDFDRLNKIFLDEHKAKIKEMPEPKIVESTHLKLSPGTRMTRHSPVQIPLPSRNKFSNNRYMCSSLKNRLF